MTVRPDPVRLLTRSQVRSALRWPGLIEATMQALIAAAPGGSAITSASQLHLPGAALHLKTGALFQPPVLTVKANLRPEAGSSAGLIVVFDPARPAVRAVLDSADITAMRTGAVAAVAARQLAATGPHVLAVLGAGPVAQQAVAALSEVISIGEIRVWSRDRAPAGQLAAALGNEITVCGSPAEAAAGAGIVLTATPATQPLLTGASLAADALVLAMGADTRGKRELGEGVLDGAELVADVPSEAAVVGELAYLTGGDVVSRCIPLGELLAGSRSLTGGRRIVFDSVGTAVVDAAAVGLVLAVAEREDLGTMIDFAG